MDADEFRRSGGEMVDFIADYLQNIRQRRPLPAVSPGYLKKLISEEAPSDGESWESVKDDIEKVIMPGVSSAHTFREPLLASSPACTELEMIALDWLGKMLRLPQDFLFSGERQGGSIILGGASEAILISLISARKAAINKLRCLDPQLTNGQALDKLVAYTSDQTHCCMEKSCLIGLVSLTILPSDTTGALSWETLEAAICRDLARGLVPVFFCATIGTTSTCAFDNLAELGPVCNKYGVWMHVDAAYAGSACICPEFRYLLDGVEHCTSISVSPHKWLLVNYDCTALWTLSHPQHWQVNMGRRFRSLKLWFVLRMYGVKGLQERIRQDVHLAKQFAQMVKADSRFELIGDVTLGLVCFRLKHCNCVNEELHEKLKSDRRIHLIPSSFKGKFFLRFVICPASTQLQDVSFAWSVINEITDGITRHCATRRAKPPGSCACITIRHS
ncbi:aromatic-L-amino-acid decarboxylase-like [Aplysia californica]|uniref:Aromatic-L-amino-acid decarboxylase-like n=1 Tax=Aplysia californica TaxID=6500 RepID=A0ABM1A7H2_APLCA|nr:aromatic-L-amino-acid decarboxylase-like [Aplysia californica]